MNSLTSISFTMTAEKTNTVRLKEAVFKNTLNETRGPIEILVRIPGYHTPLPGRLPGIKGMRIQPPTLIAMGEGLSCPRGELVGRLEANRAEVVCWSIEGEPIQKAKRAS
jgi:hypothetical protein